MLGGGFCTPGPRTLMCVALAEERLLSVMRGEGLIEKHKLLRTITLMEVEPICSLHALSGDQ